MSADPSATPAAATPAEDVVIPDAWRCPITQEIMCDPVIARDGNTYEREALLRWLATHGISPLTREPISVADLVPNRALLNTIEEFVRAHPGTSVYKPTSAPPPASTSASAHTHTHTDAAATPGTRLTFPSVPEGTRTLSVTHAVASLGRSDLCVSSDPVDGRVKGCVFVQSRTCTCAPDAPCACAPTAVRGVSIVCVIDVSGSMGESVTAGSGPSGGVVDPEAARFSRLDLVKHSVNMIIHTLTAADTLALVEFSDAAVCRLTHTHMDAAGKAAASAKLAEMKPTTSTNLWAGLHMGLELADKCARTQAGNTCVCLLTDGLPNMNPPRGVLQTYLRWLQDHAASTITVHTMGFGYQLDSKLLYNIAQAGSGTYAYIPDCTIVGTVFVNTLSSFLACAVRALRVRLTTSPGVSVRVLGFDGLKVADGASATFSAGAAQYGQDRVLVLQYDADLSVAARDGGKAPYISVAVDGEDHHKELTIDLTATPGAPLGECTYQWARASLADALQTVMNDVNGGRLEEAQKKMLLFSEWLAARQASFPDDRTAALLSDCTGTEDSTGQIGKAFSRVDWLTKWGKHYIPSVIRAHALQVCVNFKDAGMQDYGGPLFRAVQRVCEDVFCELPPPTPYHPAPTASASHAAAPPSHQNMGAFMNRAGGCVHPDTPVLVQRGGLTDVSAATSMRLGNVRRGDYVATDAAGTAFARVECVVATRQPFGMAALCEVPAPAGGAPLLITPWHPIQYTFADGRTDWVFPTSVARTRMRPCTHVHTLILQPGAVGFAAAGIPCIALGFARAESGPAALALTSAHPILAHPFFSGDRVWASVRSHGGWRAGRVEITPDMAQRDPDTGCVTAWAPSTSLPATCGGLQNEGPAPAQVEVLTQD